MKKRSRSQLRQVTIDQNFPTAAAGSIMISMGNTRVLCTASLTTKVPGWLENAETPKGWVTAEYNMMPGSTTERQRRGPNSRATEIQRLIARSLRAAVDLYKMPGVMITCDCDVIQADGGTRTASITGAYVALAQAIAWARKNQIIAKNPIIGPVAAVSVGVVQGKTYLDLDYVLDSQADVDMNIVMNHKMELIEIQGTGEQDTFNRDQLNEMLDLGEKGIRKLMRAQRAALK